MHNEVRTQIWIEVMMSKTRRMNQIFATDKRSVTLALDGFGFSEKTAGVDHAATLVPAMAEHGLDNVLVTYGQARNFTECFADVGMCLRVDATTEVFNAAVPDNMPIFGIEDALRVGADGVVMMNFPGAHNERPANEFAARLASEGDRWNMPVICEALPYGYPVTSAESNDPAKIATAARFAEELGADVIKTRFAGTEDDALITANCTTPILVLGGPKAGLESYFAFVEHAMKVGAAGVAVGRNITQDPKPLAVVAALNVLVHKNGSAAEAMDTYNSLDK